MSDDRSQQTWSEADLDRALSDLLNSRTTGRDGLSRARACLHAAMAVDLALLEPSQPVEARQRAVAPQWWLRRTAATASVAVLVAATLIALVLVGGEWTTNSAAAVELELAAIRTETAIGPTGPYLYVATHAQYLSSSRTDTGKPLSALENLLEETWIPADRSQEWGRRTRITGERQWLVGSEELARNEGDGGLLLTAGSAGLELGRCGDRPTTNTPLGGEPDTALPCSERAGDWWHPTPRFLSERPRDPGQLLARLRAGTPEGLGSDVQAMSLALDLLGTHQALPELRVALYRALRLLPGLQVVDDAVDLDGRPGIGLGLTGGTERQEIVLDPVDGSFLGERIVLAESGTGMWGGLPAGTVVQSTSVRTTTVDRIGETSR